MTRCSVSRILAKPRKSWTGNPRSCALKASNAPTLGLRTYPKTDCTARSIATSKTTKETNPTNHEPNPYHRRTRLHRLSHCCRVDSSWLRAYCDRQPKRKPHRG